MSNDGAVPKRILYIEDDEGLARLISTKLGQEGYAVDTVFAGSEALSVIETANYDLVLLDYHLPDMPGLEVLGELKQRKNSLPVIILTSSGEERMALQALRNGAVDYAVRDDGQLYLEILPTIVEAAFLQNRLKQENEQQRHELAVAVQKAELASQAKSEFLAMMSHEIRTPMNAVIGLARLLVKTPLNEQQQSMVQTLQTNADILLKMVNDLLDLSRIESGQVEFEQRNFIFGEIAYELKAVFENQCRDKHLSFSIDDRIGETVLVGDISRIQQIMMNLVSNALKFTPAGSVKVEAGTLLHRDHEVLVRLAVVDTGVGIAAEKLATIFEKFVQADISISRRFGGSGLGLAISKLLANHMGGDIVVQSEPNKGSTFALVIPLQLGEAQQPVAITPLPPSPSGSDALPRTVLIVEDYPANVMVATIMMENMGYAVEVAVNGLEAMKSMRQRMLPYTAILMDLQMQGMDGLETTRQIRAWEKAQGWRRQLIIGITAHALASDRNLCIEVGMDQYLSKPISPDLLADKLGHKLEKSFV